MAWPTITFGRPFGVSVTVSPNGRIAAAKAWFDIITSFVSLQAGFKYALFALANHPFDVAVIAHIFYGVKKLLWVGVVYASDPCFILQLFIQCVACSNGH